jgi:LysR family glycine cleavage system transcriptional activator
LKRSDVPSIRGLTCFVAAAKYQSFTRAADQLDLSQGAVSRHIRELEGHLGIHLFERIKQRVVLTQAGREYLSHVQQPLDDLVAAARKVAAFSDGTMLHVAAVPSFAARWLLPRLPRFQKANPKISVHVTMRQRPVDFVKETFNAALCYDPPAWPGTKAHHLIDVAMVPACSPALNAKGAIKTAADILKFPLLHKMSRPLRWSEWMTAAGVTLDGPLRGQAYQHLSALAEAAIEGFGIALLPHDLFVQEFADDKLEIVLDRADTTRISYHLMVPESTPDAGSVDTFARWLRAEAQARQPKSFCQIAMEQFAASK